MQLLIPFAFCSSEGCRQTLRTFKLPHLEKLLRRLTPAPLDVGTELSLSAPHERALARVLNLPIEDGLIPWAAWQAQAAKLTPEAISAWAFITPCHWQAGAKQAAMSTAELPDFTALESQTLLAAMQPYFEEDGITLYYQQPSRWLARGEIFRGLATASLDRVAGRSVANWLPSASNALPLQRLQSEMQMLLYSHPVNDAREARDVPTVNSFWISGTGALSPTLQSLVASPQCGPLPTAEGANAPTVITTLRAAALAENWQAWATAWQALDTGECAALLAALGQGESAQLTLCGERNAQTFNARQQNYLKRFMNLFGGQSAVAILEQL